MLAGLIGTTPIDVARSDPGGADIALLPRTPFYAQGWQRAPQHQNCGRLLSIPRRIFFLEGAIQPLQQFMSTRPFVNGPATKALHHLDLAKTKRVHNDLTFFVIVLRLSDQSDCFGLVIDSGFNFYAVHATPHILPPVATSRRRGACSSMPITT